MPSPSSNLASRAAESSSLPYFANGLCFPNAPRIPLSHFNNKYAGGACYIVGRGPTDFNYLDLADIADPIFFINDAICLEQFATSETFFFAHDRGMRVWLDGSIKATAVLPIEGKILQHSANITLGHAGPLTYYHRGERASGDLLQMTREEIAEREELFVHAGTIHSALHFIWLCGFARVMYIGCDGINQYSDARAYDARLRNRSHTTPGGQYDTIRKAQDLLTNLWGIEATYLGTPAGLATTSL